MTTTELATIDEPEVQVLEPLSAAKAKSLDKKIRAASQKLVTGMDDLLGLLNQAAEGQIHVALGYKSWPEYLKDSVQVIPTDRSERKQLALYMSGKGMSNRAIAAIVGADERTVRRDTEGAEKPDETAGLDGKSYKQKAKDDEAETEVIDAEVVEDPAPAKLPPVKNDFRDEMINLQNTVQAFKDIHDDERFAKARKQIAKAYLNDLQQAITDLQSVADQLME